MIHEFRLADIGEGLEEAEIVEWRVQVGDVVDRDQPLIEIMTDKSNAELPAPTSGTVIEVRGTPGDIVTVGDLIAVIDDSESADLSAAPANLPRIGEATDVDDAPPVPDATAPIDAAELPDADDAPDPVTPKRIKASPSTRRAAAARGIDLSSVTGSGPGGRVLLADLDATWPTAMAYSPRPTPTTPETTPPIKASATTVEAPSERPTTSGAIPPPTSGTIPLPESLPPAPGLIADPPPPSAPTPSAPHVAPSPSPAAAVAVPAQSIAAQPVIALRGVRRAIAQSMTQSWETIPHIHAFEHIDAEPLTELRKELRESGRPGYAAITPLAFFVAAVASALHAHPEANASIDMNAGTITRHPSVNVGVAVAAPQGLVVPVLHGAEGRPLDQTAMALHDLVSAARSGGLGPERYRDGTVTVTNFGSLGGEQATPLIRPPEAMIFGFGSVADRPFVIDGAVVARKTMHLVVAADHRLLDGDVTTAVLGHIARALTHPVSLLIEN